MNKNVKISAVAGIILYGLAAFFSICLMLVFFDFGGADGIRESELYRLGKLFTGVYGICSIFIPLFLLAAAFQCFTRTWHVRNGVILLGSIIPFFTLDAVEHFCRMAIEENTGDALFIKLGAGLLTGAIIVAVEYLVLCMLGDAIERGKRRDEIEENTVEKFVSDGIEKAANEVSGESVIEENECETIEEKEIREAVERDSLKLASARNNLKELKERLAQKRRELAIAKEESPFAHVFDEQNRIEEEKLNGILTDTESTENTKDETAIGESVNEEVAPGEDEMEEENSGAEDINEFTEENNDFEESVVSDKIDFSEPELNVNGEEQISEDEAFAEDNKSYNDAAETTVDAEDEHSFEEADAITSDFSDFDKTIDLEPDNYEENDWENENDDYESEDVKDYFFDNEEESVVIDADDADNALIENNGEYNFDEMQDADFEENTFDSEDDVADGDLSDFVEKRNSNFESIFAQMDSDAAANPVETETTDSAFDDDFDNIFNDEDAERGVPQELDRDFAVDEPFDGYEFDPSADPVVDSNGIPFGPAVPLNIGENSFEEVAKAKKESKPLSFAEKAVFLQDNESQQTAEPVKEKSKPKLKLSNYKIPIEGILQKYENDEYWVIDEGTKKKAEDLRQTLAEFNIEVEVTGIRKGPVVTMFEVLPAPGVNVNKIRSLQDNIALRLAATSVRIVSPIPGKSAVGIEIPNKTRAVVSFREIMELKNPSFEKMAIPVILGKDISGEPQIIDLAKTPHLLIAGSTGSGKSVCVNSLILSILYKRAPNLVKLILIDPKVVELKLYNDIPHLLTPVITEPNKALQSLQYCICEMERRYALLDNMGVRDISSYNRRIEERKLMQEKLPYIVVVIDEFADLMATTGKELESNVARLAAMSRAVGIHLVLATQRPSVNVITGLIKANIPSRIAFMVASRTDSNIIIDQIGAEKLLGKGDMLYASATDPFPVRIQGTLISDDEVEKVVEYVKQYGEPDYIDDEIFVEDEDEGDGNPGLFGDGEDPLYDQALEIVVQSGKASASYLQRRLKIGYNRAARLVEDMEERGIVGPANGSKPREIIHIP